MKLHNNIGSFPLLPFRGWGLFLLLIIALPNVSCKKFLDAKSDASLVIPSGVDDLQKLLDNNMFMNTIGGGSGEASADNYYLTYTDWNSLSDGGRNLYIWGDEIFFDLLNNEWAGNYNTVNRANIVLDYLDKISVEPGEMDAFKNVKGSALLFRAKAFYHLLQSFCKAWDAATAQDDLGICLRLDPDFNIPSVRASVKDSYDQLVNDLKQACSLLPVSPQYKTRPSKPAAYALLSKTYLAMHNYPQAELYADSCLQLYSSLMNYNADPSITATASFPFSLFNSETIWYTTSNTPSPLSQSKAKVDSALYNSYDINDLRRSLFFKTNTDGSHAFKGSYTHNSALFTGIATDEIYLIRAECNARLGNTSDALDDLNAVISKRWKANTFISITATDANDALNKVLTERRKELLFRDIRWSDIKRLNKEGANIMITRDLNNQLYELSPGDNRYALPLPKKVIDLTGMPQNPR
jgi:hypothetical protein